MIVTSRKTFLRPFGEVDEAVMPPRSPEERARLHAEHDGKTPARLLTWIDAGERLRHARATGAAAFAFDGRLSVEARGMLAYMLATRPERSPAKTDALFAECGIGSHKGYRILQELRDAAYVVLHREREQGRLVAGEWEIAPEPRPEISGGRFDADR